MWCEWVGWRQWHFGTSRGMLTVPGATPPMLHAGRPCPSPPCPVRACRRAHATPDRFLAAQEPVVAFSLMVGAVAVLMPITVVPLRHSMGFDTSQYYGAGISTQSE